MPHLLVYQLLSTMNPGKTTTLLCILDGFGLNPNPVANAVAMARKPNFDKLFSDSPAATLITHGERVGLPAGQMGNSEVGHLNIGAGRVVEQWLLRIGRALSGTFLDQSQSYRNFCENCQSAPALHVVGLFSTGGVHSHIDHLYLLIKRLLMDTKSDIYLHLFSDGRDASPTGAAQYIPELLDFTRGNTRCKVATVVGRFYGMDRDKRWQRTEKAYAAIARAAGEPALDLMEWISASYKKGITDEFLEPGIVNSFPLRPEHGLVFWNFREDRMRQIVRALCLEDFKEFAREAAGHPTQRTLCFTDYDETFHLPFLFSPLEIKNHLGEIISKRGLAQLRTAETEKYPHVTYFFNGGVESPLSGEDRKLVPSPREVRTYDLKPEMSAPAVTEIVLEALKSRAYDFLVVNFANCDMVGHTGVLEAAIKAVETVDICLGRVIEELSRQGGQGLIIADHGNAEQMINYEDGTPHTAHTTFPVPVIIIGNKDCAKLRAGGALCDVAPTVLKMMGVPQPSEMTGQALF